MKNREVIHIDIGPFEENMVGYVAHFQDGTKETHAFTVEIADRLIKGLASAIQTVKNRPGFTDAPVASDSVKLKLQ